MAMTPRFIAPVAAPPPPKPPQLNIVASSLMPGVETDTLLPDRAPVLASAGWVSEKDPDTGAVTWTMPPGDTIYADAVDQYNALVAAVGVMSDLELKQAEAQAGVTVDSLPRSVYPGAARWEGGFGYTPENQTPGILADPCGQAVDLPGLSAPVVTGANFAGGTLTTASYDYAVTTINANGESLPSTTVVVAVTSGSAKLNWGKVPTGGGFNIYGRTHGSALHFLATVGPNVTTFTDDGSLTPSGVAVPGANTTGGPGDYGQPNQVGYIPFLIQVMDTCSTFGWEERDYTGRALRLLDNATPNAIEREFWSGVFAQNTKTGPIYQASQPHGLNAFLTQSGTVTNGGSDLAATDLTPGTVPSITRGIQILEDYLAGNVSDEGQTLGFGGQGMLHVAPETSPNLLGARRVGTLLLSVMDNIIVPGSGYPTNGNTGPIGNANVAPGAGNAWIFATDLTSIRLGEPEITPDTMAEAVDRGNMGNPDEVFIRAQRFAAVTFDNARLAACRVALAT